MTALVRGKVDGERPTRAEIAAFLVLLSVAGNDTSRHTISQALRALSQNPAQRAWLLADPDGRLRWIPTQAAGRGSPGCDRRPAVCSKDAVTQSGSTGAISESPRWSDSSGKPEACSSASAAGRS